MIQFYAACRMLCIDFQMSFDMGEIGSWKLPRPVQAYHYAS